MNPDVENPTLPLPTLPYSSMPTPSVVKQHTIRFGVIGYGYWGPNVTRNLDSLECSRVVTICDANAQAAQRAQRHYPGVQVTQLSVDILEASDIDAVAIVTPVVHYCMGGLRMSPDAEVVNTVRFPAY